MLLIGHHITNTPSVLGACDDSSLTALLQCRVKCRWVLEARPAGRGAREQLATRRHMPGQPTAGS